MTDIMKLADNYADEWRHQIYATRDGMLGRNALQTAIEALQGEVEQVKGFWKEAQLRNRNLLEEGNDLAMLVVQYKAERDKLQAKLDELRRSCRTSLVIGASPEAHPLHQESST